MIGPLGVGKTTLLQRCDLPDAILPLFEDLEPLLSSISRWRENPSERSFFIQTAYYLNSRRQIIEGSSARRFVISDFSLTFHHFGYSHMMQESNLLTALEIEVLDALYSALTSMLPPVIGVIYCHASADAILQRIVQRGRAEEQGNSEVVQHLLRRMAALRDSEPAEVLDLDTEQLNEHDTSRNIRCFVDTVCNYASES
jgi:deoxyadenosine/deoxycytidine kinase